MYLTNKLNRAKLLGAGLALVLVGCAGAALEPTQIPSSALTLPDFMISENKGSVEGLYKSWILPFNANDNRYIPHESREQRSSSEAAVKDGFGRFCSASGGAVMHEIVDYGNRYSCSTSNGEFIGEFTAKRFTGNLLEVSFDSPERVERREAQLREDEARLEAYQNRKAQNGPSGVIVTDEGRFKFLRFGDLRERHVLEVWIGNPLMKMFPIEEILKIERHDDCCRFKVIFRDGRTYTINESGFRHRRGPNLSSDYRAMPIVVIDPESGQPYTRLFYRLRGLHSIVLDDESVWKYKSADAITTTFDPFSPDRLNIYTQKLRSEANQLYLEATEKGWIKLLPDGNLTPQLMRHLHYELLRISNESQCRGNAINGIVDHDALLRCRVADRELRLVVGGGYSLVTDVTPLSSIIVFNKIKDDIILK